LVAQTGAVLDVVCARHPHALVWYLTGDKRLGKAARTALASVDAGTNQAAISVMVLAEIMYLEEKHRVKVELNELLRQLRSNENYRIASMALGTLLAAKRIDEVPELFDRMIAATALEAHAVLLTRDPVFKELEAVKTEW
jgi:PIN domain nuclease of toxin-antitoxin system